MTHLKLKGTGKDMRKLYDLDACPYCRMVRDKLDELDLEYEKISVPANPRDRMEVQSISGQPFVPVLVEGALVLDDEEKIIAYLDKTYGKK